MRETTKIHFQYRRIGRSSFDFTTLMEMLFPGHSSQRYAAACIFLELKWADGLEPIPVGQWLGR